MGNRIAHLHMFYIESRFNQIYIHPSLFLYFGLERWNFIYQPTIHGLIIYYGISLLASSLAMTFSVQVSKENGIIDLNAIDNIFKRRLLRIVLLLLSPITPITTIVKSSLLSIKMSLLKSKWNEVEGVSASTLWLEMEKLKEEKKKVSISFSNLKLLEVNLEVVVQLFILLTYNFIPESHGLGSKFEKEDQSWISPKQF